MQLTMPCYSLCLQLGIAATVIALNATRLYTSNGCYLGATDTGFNLCNYAYAVGALSILATLVLAILQCVTCNLCGCGPVLDAIFAVVGAAWWAAAAVTWTLYFNQPNIARLPLANYRFAIFVLSWAACGLFVLLLLVSLFRMIAICCGCCGAEKRGHNYRDEEMGTGSTGCCGKRRARRSTTPADKVYVNPPQRQYITSDDAPGYQPGVQPVAAPGGRRFM
eukprot:jgi/Chrzof1/3322/Cz12g20260.t1